MQTFKLDEVVYDARARDGTWCTLPFMWRKHGCRGFPKCVNKYPDFMMLIGYSWYAVVGAFDIKAHAAKIAQEHPEWSVRRHRNSMYWEPSFKLQVKNYAKSIIFKPGDILLSVPEACGVNVFATMAKVGVFLKSNPPDTMYTVILVGKKTLDKDI